MIHKRESSYNPNLNARWVEQVVNGEIVPSKIGINYHRC